MTNMEIYKKTLPFSLRRFLCDTLSFLILGGLATAGFLLMDKANGNGLVGLAIGLLIGIILLVFILRYASYTYKAGQIAMMTKGVTEGELSGNVLKEGQAIVKQRFLTVSLYFVVTGVIKGIFNQLSRALNAVGRSVGGETGGNVADAISFAINVVVGYLCDCCLGWVFYRKEQNAAKATCEGAVLFFKHGKTLIKNLGRVFAFGLLSLLVIGGAFFGVFYLIFSRIPQTIFAPLTNEIADALAKSESGIAEVLRKPEMVPVVFAALAAVILWSILHSVFVRPFVLVGVLRNYIESGVNDIPTEASFSMLDSKSSKFRKLHTEGI